MSNILDGERHYGWISIVLHWLVGFLVIGAYFSGFQAGQIKEDFEMLEAQGNPALEQQIETLKGERSDLMRIHVGVASLFWLVLLARIVWRTRNGQLPAVPQQPEFLQHLAIWVPRLMLVLLTVMIFSGPMIIWSYGYPISPFGLFKIPSPTGPIDGLGGNLSAIHIWTGHILASLLLVHILGTLKHLVIDRNTRSLKRITSPKQPS
ncbi:MAG: cytochrome b [Gammaproteobacteria bacterium AqS3]|nr:cytochrome b [Gammaproteobacteria bacterium AqS3]